MKTGPLGPARRDPCKSIVWQFNPSAQPPGGEQLVRDVIGELSVDTGLAFTFGGYTTSAPLSQSTTDPAMVIGWVANLQNDPGLAGVGGAEIISRPSGALELTAGGAALERRRGFLPHGAVPGGRSCCSTNSAMRWASIT